ncbi:MAG: HD domain-containing protein [Candidatus Omnitrophica bacterium]|nr:HD domain-containing protein [Candidatus Omnitrophota bacterium]MBU1995842.1 HD domain-containing protein [Candidatus Omnitrophota bacterium]MBU4334137.1 HD domain-containing protein [Candidatus Omnitrophota bacterium]
MLKNFELGLFKQWFSEYTSKFTSSDPEYTRNIYLKTDHTQRVCKEIIGIAESLGLEPGEINLSNAIALFHDIGRFEQYHRYQTFADHKSENHAALGINILKENNVLDKISPESRSLIIYSVLHHNCAVLPSKGPEKELFYARMIRDADKLDIFRLVIDYYQNKEGTQNVALELGLPDNNEISDFVLSDIKAGEIVKIRNVKTLNDFKLLQLSWIYDINYKWTFKCIKDRNYFMELFQSIPKNDKTTEIYSLACSYLDNNLSA